jgi:hypothetical protein
MRAFRAAEAIFSLKDVRHSAHPDPGAGVLINS